MKTRSFAGTDTGRVRQRNEDAFLAAPKHGLFAVADGLGGLSAGDKASRLAISILESHMENSGKSGAPIDFKTIFHEANNAIRDLGLILSLQNGTGTTLTAAKFDGGNVRIGHIGDSIAFLFRDSGWLKLTADHTLAEKLKLEDPHQQIPPIARHTLLRCLGHHDGGSPDLISEPVFPGDCLFLCTDGVTLEISPDEIQTLIRENREPEQLVTTILTLARRRGGADNATAIAICIDH